MSENGLPEGWMLAALPQVCTINPRKPDFGALGMDAEVTFVPMPAVDAGSGAITKPVLRRLADVRKGFTSFRDDDVIVAKITPCMENGKAAIARGLANGLGFGSTEFHVLRTNGAVLPEYVYHFVRRESFRANAAAEMTGSVGQKRVPASFLEQTEIPLPPLAEQQRIVAKAEALLGRVNAARERLAKLPALVKRFRQAVLAAACSGRLTAHWRGGTRVDHYSATGSGPSTWTSSVFDDLCDDITVGHVGPMADQYVEKGIPFLRSQNVREFNFDQTGLKFITREFHQRLQKSALRPGDVAVVRSGNAGVACVIPESLKEANCADLVLVRPSKRLNPHFACIYLNSMTARAHVEAEKVGIAQGHFNVGSMRRMPLALPPIGEQDEIVRRVAALFQLAGAAELRAAAATSRADKIGQSILAKAFRGELVPTEAELARQEGRDYEPAALLERIGAKRATSANGQRLSSGARRGISARKTPARADNNQRADGDTAARSEAAGTTAPHAPLAGYRNANGKPRHKKHVPAAPAAIDDIDRDDVLAVIRQVFSDGARRDRPTAIREVAHALGYDRTGARIQAVLDTDLLTAVRRGILENDRGELRLLCRSADDYTLDHRVAMLLAAMGGGWQTRDEAITAAARHLGYRRTGPAIRAAFKSAINAAMRRGLLERGGTDAIRKIRER